MIMNAIVSIARLMQARGCKRNFSQFSIVPHSSLHTETDINAFHPLGFPTWHWTNPLRWNHRDKNCRAPDVAHGQVPNQDMVRLHQGCRRGPAAVRRRDQRQLAMTCYDCGGNQGFQPQVGHVFSMFLEKWLANKKKNDKMYIIIYIRLQF